MKSLAFAIVLSFVSLPVFAAMQSTTPAIKLGVWDKNQDFGSDFKIQFVVRDQDGNMYTQLMRVRNTTEWFYAFFPSSNWIQQNGDPLNWADPDASYTWNAYVKGRTVATGKFSIALPKEN